MQYQNVSTHDQNLIGFGVVQAGSTIDSENVIENPNFRLVASEPVIATVQQIVILQPELTPKPVLDKTPEQINQLNS